MNHSSLSRGPQAGRVLLVRAVPTCLRQAVVSRARTARSGRTDLPSAGRRRDLLPVAFSTAISGRTLDGVLMVIAAVCPAADAGRLRLRVEAAEPVRGTASQRL
jgi:hypothetical protein